MKLNRLFRKLHFWGALLIFIPIMVVIMSGILLQVKKEVEWIQPSTIKGSGFHSSTTLIAILDSVNQARTSPALVADTDAEMTMIPDTQVGIDWTHIDRFDIRPSKNIAKVRLNSGWEYQVDLATHQVVKISYRNSDWIEALHDGSWFHDSAKLYVFLPVALILLALWFTGGYLVYITLRNKRRTKLKNNPKAVV
jgi:uncharacterized iron-regulated membrane protein